MSWIKIHRNIQYNWIYKNSDYFRAWIIILLEVNFEDKKILIEKELIDCYRGQSLYSLKTWTLKFGKGWSIQKTRTFFNLLENDKMIITEGMRKTTRLTVCNYDTYQDNQQADNTQTTRKQQADNTQVTTTKEIKKEKKEKNIYIPEYSEFLKYALDNIPNINQINLKLKYDAWIINDWKTGKNEKIKNWKSTLLNTLQYIGVDNSKPKEKHYTEIKTRDEFRKYLKSKGHVLNLPDENSTPEYIELFNYFNTLPQYNG